MAEEGCEVVVRQCSFDVLCTGKGFFLGKKELFVVWIWSCEGKGTYSLLVFLLLGLFLAKPEAPWVVFKTALIFWQLQSQVFAGEAQKCLWAFPCLLGQASLGPTDPACFSKRARSVIQQSPLLPSEGVSFLFVLPLAPFLFSLIHRTLPAGICNMFRRILKWNFFGGGQHAVRDTSCVWAASDRFLSLLSNRPVRNDSTCPWTALTQQYQPKQEVLIVLFAPVCSYL